MAIKPICDMKLVRNCEGELKHEGAVLLGPPEEGGHDVKKYHVCVACFKKIMSKAKPER